MKSFPLVSIVTINYKQAETTNQLLKSLENISYPNFQIIVVDNHSGSDDIVKINCNKDNIKLICCTKNLGFSGGNNIGIAAAEGKYVFLLNNDTEVESGFLEPLVELMEQCSDIGAVSPKIKYYYTPELIQFAGFSQMNSITMRMHSIGHKQKDNNNYNQLKEIPFAHGCAMLIRRKVIAEIGPMPEEYFLYYEELDYSKSITNNGYKIFYQPKSVVFHKESVTVQKESILKTYYLNRNRILYMRRNFRMPFKIMASVYLLFFSVPKNILNYFLKREQEHLKAYLSALIWNLKFNNR